MDKKEYDQRTRDPKRPNWSRMENNKDKIMRKPEVSAGGCRINRSLK
jgi:hypothetical protein